MLEFMPLAVYKIIRLFERGRVDNNNQYKIQKQIMEITCQTF